MTFIQPPLQQPPQQVWGADEYGCAQRMQAEFGNQLLYCQTWNCWMIYEGGRWFPENEKQSQRWATDIAGRQMIATGANNLIRADFIKKILYHSMALLAYKPDEFDTMTKILNFRNGILHLETGDLVDHSPTHYLTQQIPYDWVPGAPCPVWRQHVKTMCKGDEELMEFIQVLAGMSMWGGDSKDQVFVHLRGEGRNGKGVFMRIFDEALGPYGLAAPLNLLTLAEGAHSTEYTTLKGKRFVSCSEMGTKKLNLGALKVLTGGDKITARGMRKDDTTFENTWVIWLATNYSLNTTGDAGDALWERYIPINLGKMIPEDQRDNAIEEKLKDEVTNSGILNWALEGCLKWRASGGKLQIPERVKRWRTDERDNSDVFGAYISERLIFDQNAKCLLSAIAGDYSLWADMNGELLKMSSKMIAADLRTRHPVEIRTGAGNRRYVYGAMLAGGHGI